jgi:hypothetical protein
MNTIVEGIHRHGIIELLEPPQGLPEGRVRVILISQEGQTTPPPRLLTFGCLGSGDTSTLEDFKYPDADWQKEWDDAVGQ